LNRQLPVLVAALGIGCLMSASVPAQQPSPATSGPSVKNPLRFSAVGVSMNTSTMGRIEIVIERWTTDSEREALLGNLVTGRFQDTLLRALERVEPRNGYIRTLQSLGWDLRYARDNRLPDGTRQIVIATDKPVSFWARSAGARTLDYPFTFLEMRMKENGKGEGRMLAQTNIAVEKGGLQLETYAREPVRLTQITQEN
jgi:hypothetical protein